MFSYYFTFRSVTGAQRAMRALELSGLRGMLLRSPKMLSQKGCGYAVRVRDPRAAAASFADNRVAYEGVYRVDLHGGAERL